MEAGGPRPKLVGIIATTDDAAVMYARWTERACARDGIQYELRQVERVDLEDAVIEAHEDPAANGIIANGAIIRCHGVYDRVIRVCEGGAAVPSGRAGSGG